MYKLKQKYSSLKLYLKVNYFYYSQIIKSNILLLHRSLLLYQWVSSSALKQKCFKEGGNEIDIK